MNDKTQRLIKGLKSMLRWGLGPGGQIISDYDSGRREAERRMRDEIRRLLKEYESEKATITG